jgi:hypothetical protein
LFLKGQKKINDEGGATDVGKFFFIIWGELYENNHYSADFSFELLIIKVFEITR